MKFKTEKQIRKHLMGLLLAALMIVGCCQMPAYAASYKTGKLNGVTVTASITISSSSATAKTTGGGGSITATARVDYWFNSTHYYTTATSYSTGGGTTVTATKKRGGAEVTGGKGTHKVVSGDYTWNTTTQTGTIYSSATKE